MEVVVNLPSSVSQSAKVEKMKQMRNKEERCNTERRVLPEFPLVFHLLVTTHARTSEFVSN